ncbi:MAG TPA: hypothetical protein VFR58_07855 [Flavisolibacter sp.]|nr:hypothetical protein [Flavisolibacter sp.]
MALQIQVQYHGLPLVYSVYRQEEDVYHLHLKESTNYTGKEYIPQKIVIRKKGMIWISDQDNYDELVNKLTSELTGFNTQTPLSHE